MGTTIHTAQRSLFDPTEGLPHGLAYEGAFIDRAEERALIDVIAALPLREARYKEYTARRRVYAFGSRFDFDEYKRSTIFRRVLRRARMCNFTDLGAYIRPQLPVVGTGVRVQEVARAQTTAPGINGAGDDVALFGAGMMMRRETGAGGHVEQQRGVAIVPVH